MSASDSTQAPSVPQRPHHMRQELCTNRSPYRQGRKLTAVKVYTVNDESCHLLIQGVPAISVTNELENLCLTYGSVEQFNILPDYPTEKFCQTYHVKFRTMQSARFAKRKMDDRSFYGGTLHVCYAPELETLEDTRNKLNTRQREIADRLNHRVRRPPQQPAQVQPHVPPEIPVQPPSHESQVDKALQASSSIQSHVPLPVPTPLRRAEPVLKRIVYHQPRKRKNPSTTQEEDK